MIEYGTCLKGEIQKPPERANKHEAVVSIKTINDMKIF